MAIKRNKVTKVIKRSGRVVPFKRGKIKIAVARALKETSEGNGKNAEKVTNKVVQLLNRNYQKNYIPEIEEMQDLVERVLMVLDFDKTAKAYILYREQHRKIRETEGALEEAVDLVDKYIKEVDWKVKENANMSYSLQGLNNYIASAVSSKYWMNRIYSKKIRNAHEQGDFHIHDLQSISAYCCGWDLQDLLRRGFTGVSGKVACNPAKHFGSILGQMVNFIYTLQGEVAGAQAFSNFDTLLAPFVRYDKLNYGQVKQEIQSFVFNMNVSTRVGFQTPFSNITLDITPPKTLAKEAAVIGGEPQKETYGEFQEEMNILNKAFLDVKDRSLLGFQFELPHLPTWYKLYRSHHRPNRFIKQLISRFSVYSSDTLSFAEWMLNCNKPQCRVEIAERQQEMALLAPQDRVALVEKAKEVLSAMAYQISKYISSLYVCFDGEAVDGIVITGGLAKDDTFVREIRNRVEVIAPVYVIPGAEVLGALSYYGQMILRGETEVKEY